MAEKRKVGRPKGTPKTGGRQKGVQNRVTSETKTHKVSRLIDK